MPSTPKTPLEVPGGQDPEYWSVRAWLMLIMLVVFMVINFADRTILAIAAQPLMRELGLSESEFGFISS